MVTGGTLPNDYDSGSDGDLDNEWDALDEKLQNVSWMPVLSTIQSGIVIIRHRQGGAEGVPLVSYGLCPAAFSRPQSMETTVLLTSASQE